MRCKRDRQAWVRKKQQNEDEKASSVQRERPGRTNNVLNQAFFAPSPAMPQSAPSRSRAVATTPVDPDPVFW